MFLTYDHSGPDLRQLNAAIVLASWLPTAQEEVNQRSALAVLRCRSRRITDEELPGIFMPPAPLPGPFFDDGRPAARNPQRVPHRENTDWPVFQPPSGHCLPQPDEIENRRRFDPRIIRVHRGELDGVAFPFIASSYYCTMRVEPTYACSLTVQPTYDCTITIAPVS